MAGMSMTFAPYAPTFHTDGVVHIPQALSADDLRLVEAAYAWRLENLGPSTSQLYGDGGATFLQSTGNPSAEPVFRRMLDDPRRRRIPAHHRARRPRRRAAVRAVVLRPRLQ